MSRTNPRSSMPNPAKRFIKWNGEKGEFSYYDKENKKDVIVPLPISFLVLDELATVTGFNPRTKSNIYSNEVHNTNDEPLNVRCFGGKGGKGYVLAKGFYTDIKPTLLSQVKDVRYTKSVYAIMRNVEKEFELINFHFHGSTLNAWIKKDFDPLKCAIIIKTYLEAKTGSITYRYPKFEQLGVTKETEELALRFDKDLQDYLREYKKAQVVTVEADETPPGTVTEEEPETTRDEPEGDVTETIYNQGTPGTEDDLPF